MASKQRVSDQLKVQDQNTARGLATIVEALLARHPGNVDLTLALRGVRDFERSLVVAPVREVA